MSMQREYDLLIFFEEIYAFFFDHVVMLGDFIYTGAKNSQDGILQKHWQI